MKTIEDFFYNVKQLSDRQIEDKFLYLGEGIARKVYAIDDEYVIKIAKGVDGLFQNQVEYYVYSKVNSTLLSYLCPILAFHPRILLMKRAIPLSNYNQNKRINLKTIRKEKNSETKLNYLADKYYLYYNDIISSSSWGELNKKNVLIDYGCTSVSGDRYYGKLFHI
ncbi:MAG: hypothetical protein H7Y18_09465 [Clostridiaceae bacterium]|nr:hypothetical protein [Clostridiaceae bacterium]